MDITFFNWDEIYNKSRKDPAAIIILAYAQTKLYTKSSSKTLLSKLNIHHIPSFLFQQNVLEQTKLGIVCNYRTEQPISYFKNSSFLFSATSARAKAIYLRALSMRRLTDNNDKIPREYFDRVDYNPFLRVSNDFIYFTPESLTETS